MTFLERAKQALQDELNPEAKREAEKSKAERRERDANPEPRFEYKAVYMPEWQQKGALLGQGSDIENKLNKLGAQRLGVCGSRRGAFLNET